jgi:hypothetical protein
MAIHINGQVPVAEANIRTIMAGIRSAWLDPQGQVTMLIPMYRKKLGLAA